MRGGALKRWLLVGAALAALASPLPNRPQTAHAESGAISGRVYCADTGQPARFATVRVQSIASLGSYASNLGQSPPNAAITTTGLAGTFKISELPPGDYVVMASQRGYLNPLAQFTWNDLTADSVSPVGPVRERVAAVLAHVSIHAGQTASVTIRLERGAEISGAVSFDDGTPAIGAQISAYRPSEASHQWDAVGYSPDFGLSVMYTDDRGAFQITGLPVGKYLVSARIPAYNGSGNGIVGGRVRTGASLPDPGRLEMYFGDTIRQKQATIVEVSSNERRSGVNIDIPVSKLRTLSGTVSAESDGHPLRNTLVGLRFPDDKSYFLRAHGDDDGTFAIPFALDGDYVLSVSAAPEGEGPGARRYKTVDVPLDVRGDVNGINVALPDAP